MTTEDLIKTEESIEPVLGESITKDYQQFVHDLFSPNADTRNNGEEYHVEKGVNLAEILSRLSSSVPRSTNARPTPDTFTHISVLSQSIQGYLRFLEKGAIESIGEKLKVDTTSWLSNLYGIENMHSYFSVDRYEGIVKVCKLALHGKYPKYAADGFTALYTRPPVIYLSSSAPPEFGKRLRSELGLPQSSLCSVPCNTMFGSPYTMDVTAFERLITDDVSCGKTPLVLIAYAGTPVSGHTDNLSRLREICTQNGVWFHVEGDTLANLSMAQVQPSIQAALTADSLTMHYSKWFGIPNLPLCTFFQTSNFGLAYSSGLVADAEGQLNVLPLWLIIQFMGTQDLKAITDHASALSQQISNRLDIISNVKRIEQPTGLSPVVIFKYTAVVSPRTLGKDEPNPPLLKQGAKVEASPSLCDKYNTCLATHLASQCSKVGLEQITIPVEGVCMKFDPLRTCRSNETSKDDINECVEILQKKVNEMDTTLANRQLFKKLLLDIPDIVVLDFPDEPVLGAFQCIPTYWKTKTVTNLSDLKKEEANDLNIRLYEELFATHKFVDKHVLSNGQICIIIGMVNDDIDIYSFVEGIAALAIELQDNTKFVDSVKDTVEEGIRIAQEKLNKERDEKMFQEGIIRNVPLVSSLVNWWSPPPADNGITGQSFDISSGRLDKTESVYKYKVQICDDQSETASFISRGSLRNAKKSIQYQEDSDGTVSDDGNSSDASVPRIVPLDL